MHIFAPKSESTQKTKSTAPAKAGWAFSGKNPDVRSILHLQHTIGNQAVGSMLQPKLEVSQPGDKYEQEADRVADQVMAMSDPKLQRQPENEEEEEKLQTKPLAGQITPMVQKQPEVDELEEEKELQDKSKSEETPAITSGLEFRINSLKGGGQPLDPTICAFFEPRFGYNFSHVRVHADTNAAKTAQAINARAFTLGNHVAMGSGEYHPNSQSGRRLLSHELVHVRQQASKSSGMLLRNPDNENVNKGSAQRTLYKWRNAATNLIENIREWLAGNWETYIGFTSTNPSLGWTEGFTYNMVSNAIGNAFSEGLEYVLKKTGTKAARKLAGGALGALIGSLGGPVGTGIGFIIGVVVESIVSSIVDFISGKKEVGEAITKASRQTARLIEARSIAFHEEAKRGHARIGSFYEMRQDKLNYASSQDTVDQLDKETSADIAIMQAGTPNVNDRSLYKSMLHDWVLEHAGDEEDANKSTLGSQWEAALKTGKEPASENEERRRQKLPPLPRVFKKGPDLDNHPEIFAYQTRGHWAGAGVPLIEDANKMIDKTYQVLKEGVQDPAKVMMGYFDNKKFVVNRTTSSQLLIRLIKAGIKAKGLKLVEEGMQSIERNQFLLTCQLDLNSADGSVYVNKWKYELDLTGPIPKNLKRYAKFEVSPD